MTSPFYFYSLSLEENHQTASQLPPGMDSLLHNRLRHYDECGKEDL